MDRLHSFVHYHRGRFLLLNGAFGLNDAGPQCVNVSNEWALRLHLGGFEGDAADFPADAPVGWRWVRNEPANVPARGSVMVFDGVETGGAGHTSVFLWGDVGSFTSFDQNWPEGSPCHRVAHDYTSVVGWFEPDASLKTQGAGVWRPGESTAVWRAVRPAAAAFVKAVRESRARIG